MAPHTITEPPSKRFTGLPLHGAKRSPIRLYTRWRPSARYCLNHDSSLNITRRQSWFLQTPRRWLLAHFRRRRLLRSFMTIPTYGRRARNPCSRKRRITVCALIRLFALPGVSAAVAAALWTGHGWGSDGSGDPDLALLLKYDHFFADPEFAPYPENVFANH